ncbi:unnamed protein product, partial [Oppiella nova]
MSPNPSETRPGRAGPGAHGEYDLIVDIGCGTGYMTELLAQSGVKHNRIIGVDIDPEMTAFAQQN